jgi:ribosome-binding factor A
MPAVSTPETRSVRLLRVGEQVRHVLSDVLMRGDVLAAHSVSVTEVRMSPDLRHATVFVKPLLGADEGEVLAALKRNVKYLRGEVAKRVNLKFSAQLKFLPDESFDEATRIDTLLRRPEVARDLAKNEE